jgi:hypothetical protein
MRRLRGMYFLQELVDGNNDALGVIEIDQLPARLNLRQGQDCITNMPGFNLRQAQARLVALFWFVK